jgi:hypothetical protein
VNEKDAPVSDGKFVNTSIQMAGTFGASWRGTPARKRNNDAPLFISYWPFYL